MAAPLRCPAPQPTGHTKTPALHQRGTGEPKAFGGPSQRSSSWYADTQISQYLESGPVDPAQGRSRPGRYGQPRPGSRLGVGRRAMAAGAQHLCSLAGQLD